MEWFSNIIGHDKIKRMLRRLYQSRQIPGFLIFEGPEGVGKASMAYEFSKLIMYEGRKEPIKSPDFFLLTPVDSPDIDLSVGVRPLNYDPTAEIKIEKVRELQARLYKKGTLEAKYKVCLVLNGEQLNIQSQNALLKTLEEPPPMTVFLMIVSHKEKVLSTVYSRARHIKFPSLSFNEFKKAEFDSKIPLTVLYRLSGGSIGRAKQIAVSYIYSIRSELLKYLIYKDFRHIYEILEGVMEGKNDVIEFLNMFSFLARDILVSYQELPVVNEDLLDNFKALIKLYSQEVWEKTMIRIQKAMAMTRANVNRRFVMLYVFGEFLEPSIRDRYDELFDFVYS